MGADLPDQRRLGVSVFSDADVKTLLNQWLNQDTEGIIQTLEDDPKYHNHPRELVLKIFSMRNQYHLNAGPARDQGRNGAIERFMNLGELEDIVKGYMRRNDVGLEEQIPDTRIGI